jgi:hypothetical protein
VAQSIVDLHFCRWLCTCTIAKERPRKDGVVLTGLTNLNELTNPYIRRPLIFSEINISCLGIFRTVRPLRMVRATFYSTGGPPNLMPQKPLLYTKINAAVKAGTIIRGIPLLSMCVGTFSLKEKAAILYSLSLLQPVRRIWSQAKPPNIEKVQSTSCSAAAYRLLFR